MGITTISRGAQRVGAMGAAARTVAEAARRRGRRWGGRPAAGHGTPVSTVCTTPLLCDQAARLVCGLVEHFGEGTGEPDQDDGARDVVTPLVDQQGARIAHSVIDLMVAADVALGASRGHLAGKASAVVLRDLVHDASAAGGTTFHDGLAMVLLTLGRMTAALSDCDLDTLAAALRDVVDDATQERQP